jgi:D-alanyl-D-alanine dipeptidase
MIRSLSLLSVVLLSLLATEVAAQPGARSDSSVVQTRPEAFVRLVEVDSTIRQDMRYYGTRNFVGRPITGYEAPQCWLTRPAAEALSRVQDDLRPFGLTLLVFDCFRPQRAVDHFVRWARDIRDTATKQAYYPTVPKGALFAEGYIASRSGHSRGSTVDLTIIPVESRATLPGGGCDETLPLPMGTGYDCFHPRSHTAHGDLAPQARVNRLLLRTMMEQHGFRNYPKEWWHYTLRGEPFPETFFDVPVE